MGAASLSLQALYSASRSTSICLLLPDFSVSSTASDIVFAETDVSPVGLGSGFSGLGSPLLITELAHPAERGKITALYKYVELDIPFRRVLC